MIEREEVLCENAIWSERIFVAIEYRRWSAILCAAYALELSGTSYEKLAQVVLFAGEGPQSA